MKLKTRIELLKLYVLLIVALVTGISSLWLRNEVTVKAWLLMIIGAVVLLGLMIVLMTSYFHILKLVKNLEK